MSKTILERIGLEAYEKLTGMMSEEVAQGEAPSKKIVYDGHVQWDRYDNGSFRAEMRADGDDMVYNFYHPKGPDPLKGFGDPDAVVIDKHGNLVVAVDKGEEISLGPGFLDLLDKVVDYVFKDLPYHIITVPELFSQQLTVVGAARRALARERYTKDFMAILEANIPHYLPDLLS